jgi:hypothetical protein
VANAVYEATVTLESTPLIKTFIPAVTVTGEPALLGPAVKETVVEVDAALVRLEASAAVFTRKIESLFKVTSGVPNVLGEDEVLGL